MAEKVCHHQCQSCGMPLKRDPSGKWGWTEKDGSISTMYCSLCYKDGAFIWWDCTVSQMQEIVEKAMKDQWYGRLMRKMTRIQIPRLARWKK